MTTRKPRPAVKVGQVWIDRDKRTAGRELRVTEISHAPDRDDYACVVNLENGHKTIIRVSSLKARFDLDAEYDLPDPADSPDYGVPPHA